MAMFPALPDERLVRIARAHVPNAITGVVGECAECARQWPCSTYLWANNDLIDLNAPWDIGQED